MGEEVPLINVSKGKWKERCCSPITLLIFLSSLNLLNYVDRGAIAAVLSKVKSQYDLNDTQAGMLASSFILGFMIAAPIFAQLSYKFLPTRLMVVGLLGWIVAAAGTALAPNYGLLITARALAGVGEASFCGLAPTTIDNNAPASQRTAWLAVFFMAIPVGYAIGYGAGGLCAAYATWKLVFLMEAILMFPLAMACFIIPAEKNRRRRDYAPVEDQEVLEDGRVAGDDDVYSLWDALKTLSVNGVYTFGVLGYAAYTFVLGGIAFWMPYYLQRHLSMDIATATGIFACVSLFTGISGTVFGGWALDKQGGSAGTQGTVRSIRWCWMFTLFGFPLAFIAVLIYQPVFFFSFLLVAEFMLFSTTAPINGALLSTVPPALRSHSMALSIFTMHLLGDFPSPVIVGAISDRWSLQTAMVILICILIVAVILWYASYICACRVARHRRKTTLSMRKADEDDVNRNYE